MAKVRDGLSVTWNGRQWLAKYKAHDGDWSAKRLPARFTERMRGAAEAWIREWYERHLEAGGWKPDNGDVSAYPRVALADIVDRWIAFRENDPGTDRSYARNLRNQYDNWIGPSELARLDVDSELGPLRIVEWLRTLEAPPPRSSRSLRRCRSCSRTRFSTARTGVSIQR